MGKFITFRLAHHTDERESCRNHFTLSQEYHNYKSPLTENPSIPHFPPHKKKGKEGRGGRGTTESSIKHPAELTNENASDDNRPFRL